MICAGRAAQVQWGKGDWIFLDVGFSSKARSCGLLVGDEDSQCVTFAEAIRKIKDEVAEATALNLVVEAPLSVCFDSSDNPTGRSIEIEGTQARYWYVGAGCAVMVASMYLLRELSKMKRTSICLFEGFVSYKSEKRSNHRDDAKRLRDAVRDPLRFRSSVFGADQLKRNQADKLYSAFRVAGFDCGIPAVIKPQTD